MSWRQYDEVLESYAGPIFPTRGLLALHKAVMKNEVTGGERTSLTRVVRHVLAARVGATEMGELHPVTVGRKTRYDWYRGYQWGNGLVLLTPWAQDWCRTDGTQYDRCPAGYYSPSRYTRGAAEKSIGEAIESIAATLSRM